MTTERPHMQGFVEFVTGDLRNRGNVVRREEVRLNGERRECYRSLFIFDEGLPAWVERTGSVKGYAGPHVADGLVFDFDGPDLEQVRLEVAKFVRYLERALDVPLDNVRLAFSGSKGFHVTIPIQAFTTTPRFSPRFYEIERGIAADLAGDFQFIDPSIYEIRRLFRLTNTINAKSGLYKIPLALEELERLTAEEIRALAQNPRDLEPLPASELRPVPILSELYEKHARGTTKAPPIEQKPTNDWREKLQGVGQGQRSNAAVSLAGMFIERKFPESDTLAFLETWNKLNAPPLPEEELEHIVRGAYRRYAETAEGFTVHTLEDGERAYLEQMNLPDSAKVHTGFPMLDRKIRAFIPGQVFTIVAKSGNAKSAIEQNILVHYAERSGRPTVFFSLEMPLLTVYERTVQMTLYKGSDEIENEYRTPTLDFSQKVRLMFTKLKNFYVVTGGIQSVEDMKACLDQIRTTLCNGQKIGLVGVDYLSLIGGRGKDIFERTALNARALKQLAKDADVPLMLLVQTTKSNNQHAELDADAGRDSGAIFEASDYFLTMWRLKDETDEQVISLKASLCKNRSGGHGTATLILDRRTMQMLEKEGPSTPVPRRAPARNFVNASEDNDPF
jgi:hypothetical protein